MQRGRMQISVTSKWNKLCCHRCFRAVLLSLLQDKELQQAARHWQVRTAARIGTEALSGNPVRDETQWDWPNGWSIPCAFLGLRCQTRSAVSGKKQSPSPRPPHARKYAGTHIRTYSLSLFLLLHPLGCCCWVGQTDDLKILSPDKLSLVSAVHLGRGFTDQCQLIWFYFSPLDDF